MKIIAMVVCAALIMMGVGVGVAQEVKLDAKPKAAKTTKQQTVCPVMGGAVDRNLFVDHNGKRLYVCCAGCIAEVKKDPARYIAKLENDGVTLDKTPAAEPKKEQPTEGKATPSQACDKSAMQEDGCCK